MFPDLKSLVLPMRVAMTPNDPSSPTGGPVTPDSPSDALSPVRCNAWLGVRGQTYKIKPLIEVTEEEWQEVWPRTPATSSGKNHATQDS